MFDGISMMLKSSWFQKLKDFIIGFFAFIPQIMYFLYTCCASFLDFLQYLIRKLAGLDVYYIDGVEQQGDIVVSFVRGILGIDKSPAYSSLTTVFWSLVIFGCILLVLTTIFSIIKAHYNYDAKKSHPIAIIGSSLKSLALMAIVPIVAVFGLYLSQIVLQTLDEITSTQSASVSGFDSNMQEFGNVFQAGYIGTNKTEGSVSEDAAADMRGKVYSNFDFFGTVAYTNTATFSGVMFKSAAYECNRVRLGSYTAPSSSGGDGNWDNFGVFFSTNDGTAKEDVANQIDYAFSNALKLKTPHSVDFKAGEESGWVLAGSFTSPYSATVLVGLANVKCFSKYNVGLVWYYYNLWAFNFLIGFAGIVAFLLVLGNVTFGLIVRMIQLLALFFVFPPLIGIAPLDSGNAFGKWRKQFISDTLMAYGAIIGMNIFFLILPFLNTISFFNITILDNIMNVVIMLAGLAMITKLISMISDFIGAGDANKTGEETRKATTDLASKGLQKTMKAATFATKFTRMGGGNPVLKGLGKGASALGTKIANSKGGKKIANSKFGKLFSAEGRAELQGAKTESQIYNDNVAAEESRLGRKLSDKEKESIKKTSRVEYNDQFRKGGSANKLGKFTHGAAKVLDAALVPFGAKRENDASGKWDAGAGLKAFGTAVLDVSKLGFKTVGKLSGASDAYEGMKKRGDADEIKTFFQAAGGMGKGGTPIPKSLKTKKQKEDEENDRTKEEQANVAKAAENTDKTYKEIQNLITKLSSMS